MQYKWQVPEIEKDILTRIRSGDVPSNEIGLFQVYTKSANLLKKGEGTLFIYIQGVDVKYGSEDFVGNSPTSWVEESLFPDVNENVRKNYLLPIGHVAKRLNFDHFVSYVFPTELTARGFDVSMKALLSYLGDHKFTSIIISFSNGAALTGEWLLDMVSNSDTETMTKVKKLMSLVVCAGGPCQKDDFERNIGFAGKVGISSFLVPLHPIAKMHPFVKRAGGVEDLRSRVRYLFSLDNLGKARKISGEKWATARDILGVKTSPFKLIFLADYGQRVVLSKGPISWYSIFSSGLRDLVEGLIAKDVNKHWFEIPSANHLEIKQLWSLIALIGTSLKLRQALGFSPIANEIANVWPTRRFEVMRT